VLKDEIKWPTPEERVVLASTYKGIFKDVVGIFDCTEWEIAKPGESNLEDKTYSGKAKTNTYKTLAVIDKHGKFIYISRLMEGHCNDRNQWVQSDLYMECGAFFTGNEKLASDGKKVCILCSVLYIKNSSYTSIIMCLLLLHRRL
jgi:DDE superfamily endonuclease